MAFLIIIYVAEPDCTVTVDWPSLLLIWWCENHCGDVYI